MTDAARLIEHAFPLKHASLDRAHEENVRHAHISTLHTWLTPWPLRHLRGLLSE
jgi:adenine-specific DNA methylase